jgi:hypothetical protein
VIDWIAVDYAATLQLHKMTHTDPQLLVPGGRFATLAMDTPIGTPILLNG